MPRIPRFHTMTRQYRIVAFAACAVLFGAGAYALKSTNAASYLSDDPKACLNCHIMQPMYDSWKASPHASVTNCMDCHTPHSSAFAGYVFKSRSGLRHSFVYLTDHNHKNIKARPDTLKVINDNCIRCHSDRLDPKAQPQHAAMAKGKACSSCHAGVPHGGE
ncbi:MAG: cytochrome c nitrite reductase small subunit [Armatimonadetes bacterium]|nr:cytochrome c nitrite reductase small subunit [Armatimonadota bacterium]